ncbi:MAG: aconitate hydratase [Phycisphaerae bacterium]|nr:aconitate hydratase [Phycisphaerae bacterium]
MGQNLVYKILAEHLVDGTLAPGSEIGVRIDQCLTQDATGTTAYLLFESMGLKRIRCDLAVSYVDHNMAQFGPENHTDHMYLQSIAPKVGAYHSRPGNGICHQVHLERFGRPGATLLGSDSHTPTGGGLGMLSIGAGGLDVAVAMGGGPFYMTAPRVIGVELKGRLQPWVASKDVILRLLSILSTKGNVGCVVEYFGQGVSTLNVPARSTCTNMGAELGVTTSIFPSDDVTRQYLTAQGRGDHWKAVASDPDAAYDRITKKVHAEKDGNILANLRRFCVNFEESAPDGNGFVTVGFDRIVIDLDELEPMIAAPGSPDHIKTVGEVAGLKTDQVMIGSCTNSSYQDLSACAKVLQGRRIADHVELGINPGSRQVLRMISERGDLTDFINGGARILEVGCGPCIGQGQSPAEGAVSVRTFNRNFWGRSGTPNDQIYLVSPQTAIATAIAGQIVDPREFASAEGVRIDDLANPESFPVDDGMILPPLPEAEADKAEVVRGSSIVTPPAGTVPPEDLRARVLIKVGDKITTDHISPAGSFLKYRSNVPEYAKATFLLLNEPGKPKFHERALAAKEARLEGVVVGGDSYGQGSSREHAALCPMFLGVRVVLAKAIERIHKANLINFGIVPLIFESAKDYDRIEQEDEVGIEGLRESIERGDETVIMKIPARGVEISCRLELTGRQRTMLLAGGLLNATREGKL